MFTTAPVTPLVANEAALAETLRRLRMETGKWDKVSILLPDSWFRINIVDLPSLPDRDSDATDVVRWSLKKTLPIPPEQLRIAYSVLSRGNGGAKVLVLSALEATLAAIERVFTATGFEIVLIEPLGLNLWNAIAVRQGEAAGDHLFFYLRNTEFTTAVFRGAQPVFIRSRNLGSERTLAQEIRLSASYLRDSLSVDTFANWWVAGEHVDDVHGVLAEEFNTQVRPIALKDFAEDIPPGVVGLDAELTAATGVFTG